MVQDLFHKNRANHGVHDDKHYYASLSRNMLITVVVVSLIPLVFVTGLILYNFQTSYTEKVLVHLETLVDRHRQAIDIFLTERQHNIHFLAQSYGYEKLKDERFLNEQLEMLRREYGQVFSDLGVVRDDGTQMAYAGPFRLDNADYSNAAWFKQAIRSDFFVSDVFSGLRGFPHFIVASRRVSDGHPWVLRATVDFQAFNHLVQNIRIGETGVAFILNAGGEPQTDTPVDISQSMNLYRRIMAKAMESEGAVRTEVIERLKDRKRFLFSAGLLNQGNWILIYQQDPMDALSDVRKSRWIALLVFVIGGMGIVTMAILVSRRMVGRIIEADQQKELMNQQVIETGRLASLGEMAAGIAHEINNPVAIMVEEAGWIGDLLEEEEFAESENLSEFRRALEQIGKQGIRCRDITHKLLSFARRSDSAHQVVNVNAMVEEVVELFSHQARFSNVVLHAQCMPDLPCIHVSQTEIQQVLFNLINNALDAMRDQGGRIDIITGVEEGQVVIAVKDNGPGIPRTVLPRIFDPFFTTKPVGKGTGLGLSICYGILHKIGGEITVNSAVGVGTTFRVYIPDLQSDDEPETCGTGESPNPFNPGEPHDGEGSVTCSTP